MESKYYKVRLFVSLEKNYEKAIRANSACKAAELAVEDSGIKKSLKATVICESGFKFIFNMRF